jgi:hypothetical protein
MFNIHKYIENLKYLKVFFSPFKRPEIKFYFGKIKFGTPYFYPRKWVKMSKKKAHEITLEKIKEFEEKSKKHPEYNHVPTYEDMYKDVINSHHAVPKKIGFDFVGLGYKMKWGDGDYRFEYGPLLSFVFFKLQFVIYLKVPEINDYWETWLFYENETDKTKSNKERIEYCKKNNTLNYTISDGITMKEINYYDIILKDKYK